MAMSFLSCFFGGRQRLAEQIDVIEDLDAALAHRLDELVVLPLGALDPQHVVEQQVIMIGGGQALQIQPWPMHDHLAQLADF